ncbi:hypothetical protein H257_12885 [Aphanomyces astaci]|uniref:Major facilitator superfamily (MFS) profile domain-containing protein n=1 Tax=Aphanomyces astaci TaxID=112090 RepID=W4FZM4_APHAT|nr:hypothetical protein H257_12885 [Aphanomyces astaci]ETV72103.1 hypothetical protein H257_12885 [Aphanomyces astaci]|eukprot:XP_009838546.1 hypothetical protein H257_12885 [Aphanomyces astaci]
MGKAGASIGSYGCSLWVKDPSFGYDGALFYTFPGISLATIVLTWFCMFGNNESSEVMEDFKNKLLDEDKDTHDDSFSAAAGFDVNLSPAGCRRAAGKYSSRTTIVVINYVPLLVLYQ